MKELFEVRPSPIHGLGIFATCFIPKGTALWQGEEGKNVLLLNYTQYKVLCDSHEPSIWDLFHIHAYYEREIDCLVYCLGNIRFMNHSLTPNSGNPAGLPTFMVSYALTDIQAGEEITGNYLTFDQCPWEGVENFV